MTTSIKDAAGTEASQRESVSASGGTRPGESTSDTNVRIDVTKRSDVGSGFYEIAVTVDDRSRGSSFVVTSPRSFAFRRSAAG